MTTEAPPKPRDSSRHDRFYSWRDRIVFISNIPFHYKAQDVMLLMRQFGRCFRVDLARNANGKSRGFAFIEFENMETAALAAEYLDGASIDERFLRAEISQFPPDELVDIERAAKDREESRSGPRPPRTFRRVRKEDPQDPNGQQQNPQNPDGQQNKRRHKSKDSESGYEYDYYDDYSYDSDYGSDYDYSYGYSDDYYSDGSEYSYSESSH